MDQPLDITVGSFVSVLMEDGTSRRAKILALDGNAILVRWLGYRVEDQWLELA